MLEKVCLATLVIGAAWFAKLPDIVRWHDELGVDRQWSPSGEAAATASDALGRKIAPGAHYLFVMSDCAECSFKSISRETIFTQGRRGPVLVAFQNPLAELDATWRKPGKNVFILANTNIEIPAEWIAHAPFSGPVSVTRSGERLVVVPRRP